MSKLLRRPWGRGFTYQYAKSGETLKDRTKRDWVESLAIPPAWTEVEIDLNKESKVYATGYDSKKRKQYIYNPEWRALREKEKFNRIARFADQLPTMRRSTGQHLLRKDLSREKVLAAMVRLLDNAYFRPGSRRYARENETYGLTTLRSKHLDVDGARLIFSYTGKSGKEQEKEVRDPRLVRIIKNLDELPGYEIFKYQEDNGSISKVTRDDLNDYIHQIMGENFSAKDFRTWGATYLAAKLLSDLGVSSISKESEANILQVIDQVAAALGNTRSVARSSYIDPRIIDSYHEGRILEHFIEEASQEIEDATFMNPSEVALAQLLLSR